MTLHSFPRKVACRTFPLTLKGPTRVWFGSLALESTDNFRELARMFQIELMASRRRKRFAAYLITIKQGKDKSLKTYISRFNKECMTTDDQDENITLTTLLGRVCPQSQFMSELARRTQAMLREFMDQANNFINVEDTRWALTKSIRK
ncbi:uncharacterized protein LOC121241428 [Juglans microcarpa x Juglans regia]|uniref:uncharacterized protein LOC121241428 n=1 Tax=Juglans microcarpa x Juglans regia TaxID=2249226 RepID=UPI001B7E35DF|nr:uncharacterized protein LOC121241428 [Juglans microcarpa x Juglans regia]